MTNITIGAFSTKGLKQENEDSYGVMFPDEIQIQTKGVAIAIADGMSGCAAGKAASETCVKCFLSDYFSTPDSWSVKKSAQKILLATNSWMYSQGQNLYDSELGMVSTLSAMVLKGNRVHIFHIGDSRISVLQGKSIEPLTTDHRQGKSNYLTRAMGTGKSLEIDYRVVEASEDDIFILTTDGVHEYLTFKEVRDIIRDHEEDLPKAAQLICEKALERGSDDNLTCQLIKMTDIDQPQKGRYLTGTAPLPFPPLLEPGQILEGFEVIRELHANARSQVYLVKELSSGKIMALKTPCINFNDDIRYIEMFYREEWIGRQLNSPHLLKVPVQKKDRKFLYYVMEYVEGQTIREWMNDHPAPELAKIRGILRQVIQGLRVMHRLDMVHQDIKPENIIIDGEGTVKIIDFGSVKVASLEEGSGAEISAVLAGAVNYTAPEYLLYGDGDKKSDIFSLGVVIYEMLTGELPYGKGFSTVRRARQLSYISATNINPDVPPWLDQVLKKAVDKDPRMRYQYLSEFEQDFSIPPKVDGKKNFKPLLQRNPLLFWQILSLILGFLLVLSLVL